MVRAWDFPVWTPLQFADRGVRWELEEPLHMQGVVRIKCPELAELLDFEQLRVDRSRRVADTLEEREADLLVQVPCICCRTTVHRGNSKCWQSIWHTQSRSLNCTRR